MEIFNYFKNTIPAIYRYFSSSYYVHGVLDADRYDFILRRGSNDGTILGFIG